MSEIQNMSIAALGAAYRERTLSPVEVTEDALQRIAALNDTLNAFNTVTAELALARAKAAANRIVSVVPFFNLTAARYDMHRRHFCSFSNQLKIGSCCDCTHLCYTPLFWDTFFQVTNDATVNQQLIDLDASSFTRIHED